MDETQLPRTDRTIFTKKGRVSSEFGLDRATVRLLLWRELLWAGNQDSHFPDKVARALVGEACCKLCVEV